MRHIYNISKLIVLALAFGSIFTGCKDDYEGNYSSGTLPTPRLANNDDSNSGQNQNQNQNQNSGDDGDLDWSSNNKGQGGSTDYMEYTITDVRAGAVLTFEYFVSSEQNCDFFNVYIYPEGSSYSSSNRVIHASGTSYSTFQTFSYTFVNSGNYGMRVEYVKDGSVDSGQDRAAVRNFSFTNGPEQTSSTNYGQSTDGTYWWTSPTTDHGNVSWHTWTLTVKKVGAILSFDYRVSSENNYDFLNVYIYPTSDESNYTSYRVLHESGTTYSYFRNYRYTFSSTGAYTMRAEYSKDGSGNSGEDKAWIQNLGFVSSSSVKAEISQAATRASVSEANIVKKNN